MSTRPLRNHAPFIRQTLLTAVAAASLATLAACGDDPASTGPDSKRVYGAAQNLGNGQVRTFLVRDDANKPVEIGVAFNEGAMEGLPAATAAMQHEGMSHETAHAVATELLLELPAGHGTQYKLVELNWNPAGHEPEGIYTIPHFDFHFYNITKAERDQIDPTNAQYVTNARNAPDAQFARAFFLSAAVAANAPAEAVTVPRMGLHWVDTKSPELQGMVGNPAGYKPFTATYIQGAWAGKFIFEEPMITRAHILAKKTATDPTVRDQILPITAAAKASPAGYYPASYRIMYDATAKEYRISLSQLSYKE
ncbi:MAG: DUF5602 domain-containing protein [Gemmatimonadota bacterium]